MKQSLMTYTVKELLALASQDQLVLRPVDARHMRRIRHYIIEQFGTGDVFLSIIIASRNEGCLHIIDGNSRLKAIFEIYALLDKMLLSESIEEQKKAMMLRYGLDEIELGFQIFENMPEQERHQAYIDLNTRGKRVAMSKRISYDSRNAVNLVTSELLREHEALKFAGVEQEKVSLNRPHNKKFLSVSQLRKLVSLFLLGKEGSSTIQTKDVTHEDIEQRMPLLKVWLEELFKLEDPRDIGNYHVSVLASFTFVRALAHYALLGEEDIAKADKQAYIRTRMQALKHISWETKQPLWERFRGRYRGKDSLYFVENDKKTLESIMNWLTGEGVVKR